MKATFNNNFLHSAIFCGDCYVYFQTIYDNQELRNFLSHQNNDTVLISKSIYYRIISHQTFYCTVKGNFSCCKLSDESVDEIVVPVPAGDICVKYKKGILSNFVDTITLEIHVPVPAGDIVQCLLALTPSHLKCMYQSLLVTFVSSDTYRSLLPLSSAQWRT